MTQLKRAACECDIDKQLEELAKFDTEHHLEREWLSAEEQRWADLMSEMPDEIQEAYSFNFNPLVME